MTTAALKKKIKALVDRKTDTKVLEKVHDLLAKETKEERVRKRMLEVAEASERDIRAGRTYSLEEFDAHIDQFIKDLYTKKAVHKTAASRAAGAVKQRSKTAKKSGVK
ncbi:MAG: hypothetical protein ABI599_10585 [Flavobacteriales bacterium]